MRKSRKTINLEEIRDIFSKEPSMGFDEVKKTFLRPETIRETKEMWTS